MDAPRLALRLAARGWAIELEPTPRALPGEILARYPWFPAEHRAFVERVAAAVAPGDQRWLLTAANFAGTADAAFAWNEWERLSLDAAAGDAAWTGVVASFWWDHLPILMSVDDGYGYRALARETGAVVAGREPEFEQTTVVAPSLDAFLAAL